MPALPRRADRHGDHLIVCGDGPLSYRITEELTSRYGERVTVILPSRRRNHGPQISALPRVRVLEHPELSSQAFTDADVQSARALAVLSQDDVGNLHAGLRAQELNPGLRLVLAIFNRRLGDHIRMMFPDCTVLSGTAMSAPAFVAAALGEPAPSHVRLQRRTLYVARREDVAASAVICGLATSADDHEGPRLLPPGEGQADLVLAVADGTPRNPLTRRRNPARAAAGLARRLVWHKFGLVFTALLAVIGIGLGLLATLHPPGDALYQTLMDLTGFGLHGPGRGRDREGRAGAADGGRHGLHPGDHRHRGGRPADRFGAPGAAADERAHHRRRARQRRHRRDRPAARPGVRRGVRGQQAERPGYPAGPPAGAAGGDRRRVPRGDAARRPPRYLPGAGLADQPGRRQPGDRADRAGAPR